MENSKLNRYERAAATLKNKGRSAWDKGATLYALELLEQIQERARYECHDPINPEEFKAYALNGAENWNEYSKGGNALIYDEDIAARLCSPSKLKRCKGGELPPNSRENWIDVQATALYQAFRKAESAYFCSWKEEKRRAK